MGLAVAAAFSNAPPVPFGCYSLLRKIPTFKGAQFYELLARCYSLLRKIPTPSHTGEHPSRKWRTYPGKRSTDPPSRRRYPIWKSSCPRKKVAVPPRKGLVPEKKDLSQ